MENKEHADIKRLRIDDREIVLVGTAHISQDSVDTVKTVIEEENPDTVCVELDEQRYKALRNPKHWESLNLVQVLRKGQAPFLLAKCRAGRCGRNRRRLGERATTGRP